MAAEFGAKYYSDHFRTKVDLIISGSKFNRFFIKLLKNFSVCSGSNFTDADMIGVDFTRSNFRKEKPDDSILNDILTNVIAGRKEMIERREKDADATLTDAIIINSNFNGANYTFEQIKVASIRYDENTERGFKMTPSTIPKQNEYFLRKNKDEGSYF